MRRFAIWRKEATSHEDSKQQQPHKDSVKHLMRFVQVHFPFFSKCVRRPKKTKAFKHKTVKCFSLLSHTRHSSFALTEKTLNWYEVTPDPGDASLPRPFRPF
jgi:hypothetical protein